MRKNKIKLIASILAAVCIVLIACVAIIFIGKKTLDEKQTQIDEMQYELDSNKQTVYVAMSDITAGEVLTTTNVQKQQIYTGLESDYYITDEMMGSTAVVNIKALQPIMANMVTSMEITQDTREYEISVANLMTDQKENDYIDIRIMFPTGEDYTVLSKKPVYNLNPKSCVFYTYLNEDEISRMASATVDAYTITGAYIYATRYLEPSLQTEAIPNYIVKPEVIDLINSDPNIVEIAKDTLNLDARMDLEERLRGLSTDTLSAVSKGHDLHDTAGNRTLLDMEYSDGTENLFDDVNKESEISENNEVSSENSEISENETTNEPEISNDNNITEEELTNQFLGNTEATN